MTAPIIVNRIQNNFYRKLLELSCFQGKYLIFLTVTEAMETPDISMAMRQK